MGAPRAGPPGRLRGWLTRPAIAGLALDGYRRERLTELTMPVAGGLMEGGFVGVIADKVYSVHPAVLALITAAPMFGNLSSFLWARLSHGRPKVPLITGLQATIVVLTGSLALLPEGRLGATGMVLAMVATRLAMGGIVTVRSLVWTHNYPRESRARITARLTLITLTTMTLTSLAGGFFLDADPHGFRTVYAAGAAIALLGVVAFSGVRVVDEPAHLAREREDRGPPGPGGAGGQDTRPARESGWQVLRSDPLFARYQTWQFLLGTSNMLVEAPLIYLVSRQLGAGYAASVALTVAIPLGASVATQLLWAGWFDRVHITEFRARHSWLWVASQFTVWVGAMLGSLAWIAAGRLLLGLARGGGTLAWQLGHNDFADPRRAGLYMGIHVTLTGVRGAFAPFLGMLLYVGWEARDVPLLGAALPGLGQLPGFGGLGGNVMGLAALLSTVATLGFGALARRVRAASA